eukprot:GHRQ01022402.1.p1 GENE.GHRQ01022402.1~~GHRQ01022402.1.p1  ORF type:complete len:185 (-),score=17.19 GHRQ01022402.1:512-1066(-)
MERLKAPFLGSFGTKTSEGITAPVGLRLSSVVIARTTAPRQKSLQAVVSQGVTAKKPKQQGPVAAGQCRFCQGHSFSLGTLQTLTSFCTAGSEVISASTNPASVSGLIQAVAILTSICCSSAAADLRLCCIVRAVGWDEPHPPSSTTRGTPPGWWLLCISASRPAADQLHRSKAGTQRDVVCRA